MPLYPYRCTKCDHHFEKIQKFGAKPEKVCPKCGGALERTLTAPSLNFKGAGWYVNDYAAKGSSSAGGSSAKESSSAEKKTGADTKTESGAKTESKSESKKASGESGSSSSTTSSSATASKADAK